MNVISSVIERHGVAVGTMLRMARDPAVMRILRNAGIEWVIIDFQHSGLSWTVVSDLIWAARCDGVGTVVRVPELRGSDISRVLDIGASGVMAPMVSSVAEAQQLVEYSKYPPMGKRSIAGMHAHTDYMPMPTKTLLATGNQEVLCIAQIETKEGVKSAKAIAALKGIDALLVGPNDLALSLGCAGDLENPVVEKAIASVLDHCRQAGKPCGIHAVNPDYVASWIKKGMQLALCSADTILFHDVAKQLVQALKPRKK